MNNFLNKQNRRHVGLFSYTDYFSWNEHHMDSISFLLDKTAERLNKKTYYISSRRSATKTLSQPILESDAAEAELIDSILEALEFEDDNP